MRKKRIEKKYLIRKAIQNIEFLLVWLNSIKFESHKKNIIHFNYTTDLPSFYYIGDCSIIVENERNKMRHIIRISIKQKTLKYNSFLFLFSKFLIMFVQIEFKWALKKYFFWKL